MALLAQCCPLLTSLVLVSSLPQLSALTPLLSVHANPGSPACAALASAQNFVWEATVDAAFAFTPVRCLGEDLCLLVGEGDLFCPWSLMYVPLQLLPCVK